MSDSVIQGSLISVAERAISSTSSRPRIQTSDIFDMTRTSRTSIGPVRRSIFRTSRSTRIYPNYETNPLDSFTSTMLFTIFRPNRIFSIPSIRCRFRGWPLWNRTSSTPTWRIFKQRSRESVIFVNRASNPKPRSEGTVFSKRDTVLYFPIPSKNFPRP